MKGITFKVYDTELHRFVTDGFDVVRNEKTQEVTIVPQNHARIYSNVNEGETRFSKGDIVEMIDATGFHDKSALLGHTMTVTKSGKKFIEVDKLPGFVIPSEQFKLIAKAK